MNDYYQNDIQSNFAQIQERIPFVDDWDEVAAAYSRASPTTALLYEYDPSYTKHAAP
jgi:hypothetical protein